jgi:hypothetical protein
MKKLFSISAMLFIAASVVVLHRPAAQVQVTYVPKAELCVDGTNVLCSKLPAYIGPDPLLTKPGTGYKGLFAPPPTMKDNDVQTPFDNMAWQMFVALNWATSAVSQPPSRGLTAPGRRVFQNYPKVSLLFGNDKIAACPQTIVVPKYYIGSDGLGNPRPKNEEYFQASTNLPLIDINGNWTIFERRVNEVEAQYLRAPNGLTSQTLTTMAGQLKFISSHPNGPKFTPSAATPLGSVGSIEIKTAWRIIDRNAGDDPSRYFTQLAMIGVPGDLVNGRQQFCSSVTLGLVGMHIIQRNPNDSNNPQLKPRWIWATFEHVDNAPMAQSPCSVANAGASDCTKWLNTSSCGAATPTPGVRYSYYRPNSSIQGSNIRPKSKGLIGQPTKFPWNRRQPYAKDNTTPETAMPQATRCFSIYKTTDQLNQQWQNALKAVGAPFQYYMLVGTQWGAAVEPEEGQKLPSDAVPAMLSNITLETYIQLYTQSTDDGGPGSCVGCHSFAQLPAGTKPQSDFSFLPALANSKTARNLFSTPK